MGWTGCIRCEKFWCDFKAQTCALIAPVQPILHQVSCSNETLTKAPKHYETHQNRSLGSNWVYWVHSLRKLPMRFHATNLCINSTIFSPFCIDFCAVAKQFKMHPNTKKCTKSWVYGPMGWIGCVRCEKFPMRFMAQTCPLVAPVQPILLWVSCNNETLPNAPKTTNCSKTWV